MNFGWVVTARTGNNQPRKVSPYFQVHAAAEEFMRLAKENDPSQEYAIVNKAPRPNRRSRA